MKIFGYKYLIQFKIGLDFSPIRNGGYLGTFVMWENLIYNVSSNVTDSPIFIVYETKQ